MQPDPEWWLEARAMRADGASYQEIAAKFGKVYETAWFACNPDLAVARRVRNREFMAKRYAAAKTFQTSAEKRAHREADAINRHWRSLGYEVGAHAIEEPFHHKLRMRLWRVDSDLVNGLPQGFPAAKLRRAA